MGVSTERWEYNFVGGESKVDLRVTVTTAENGGWRADIGVSKGSKVSEIKSEWSRSFEGAVKTAKMLARTYGVKWKPFHFGTKKEHKPGTAPPSEVVATTRRTKMSKGLSPKTAGEIIKTLRKAKRLDLVGTVVKAAANQAQTVEYLKKAGILPPDANVGTYPTIGNDDTWKSLDDDPVVNVKRDTIAALIKAKRIDLANIVARTSVKELFGK